MKFLQNKIMNSKQATLFMFTCIVIGGISLILIPQVEAHVDENNPNHAHVCTANDPLIVRESFSKNSKNIGSLPKGTVVTVIGNYYTNSTSIEEPGEGWTHIKYKNTSGFINSNFVCY